MGFGAFLNLVTCMMSYHYQEQVDIAHIHQWAIEVLLNFKFETLKLIFPALRFF